MSSTNLDRRTFLKSAGALGATALMGRGVALGRESSSVPVSQKPGKAPYRVIFSNDTTNITTCISPYHKKGEEWRPEMLEATVDEVAGHGVDAHFIQLAHGQVPWYQSKIYPLAQHHRWWEERFGVSAKHAAFNLNGIHSYILDGGDLLQVFIDRCRKVGQAPFVSMRMNDVHHVEHVDTPGNTRGIHSITRFYAEHPEWRLGTDLLSWSERALNWAVPEVRDWVFGFIAEQCRNYDIDGFELDFQRFPSYFRLNETTSEQRRKIMREFIARVRAVLDENGGRHRWLGVRIPCYTGGFDSIGIDLPQWVDAGVEMVNVSPFYFTAQDTEFAAIRAMAPTTAMYLEMCHSTWNGKRVAPGYDAFTFRRTTPEQYETTAHLAYQQGADGVSLFNFVYYREHGRGERGPFNEPPFHALDHLGDREYLAKQPQHWFLAPGWKPSFNASRFVLPKAIRAGETHELRLMFAAPTGGWKRDGVLRFQAEQAWGGAKLAVKLNDEALSSSEKTGEPYPNPYPPLLGDAQRNRAWSVPARLLRDGWNHFVFTLEEGDANTIEFIDLGVA